MRSYGSSRVPLPGLRLNGLRLGGPAGFGGLPRLVGPAGLVGLPRLVGLPGLVERRAGVVPRGVR
ncbi:hypothetical protein, partial [Streptomyces sp. SID6137]|uniref:hypothetical protein n=1 Tax=Streptomyces sp. SID6137 TaxID=2690319 RepID=UPI001F1F79CA